MTGEAMLFHYSVDESESVLIAMVYFIIMFDDLECEYVNPIDLCNRLNTFVIPEMASQAALTILFLLSDSWIALYYL